MQALNKVLNIQHSAQGSTFHRVFDKALILYILGLFEGCEYVRFTQGTEYA